MKIQYISDLHPAMWGYYKEIGCCADILVIAGDSTYDVPKTQEFILKCMSKWRYLVYVPGNHDFYSNGTRMYNDLDNQWRSLFSSINNAYYLNNDVCTIEGIPFAGSCLWSSMNGVDTKLLNDFNHIYISGHKFDEDDERILHETAVRFFTHNIIDGQTISVTHFSPIYIGTSHPKYLGSCEELNEESEYKRCVIKKRILPYYGNDLSGIMSRSRVCIYGHTHYSNMQMYNNCYYLSNQLGYPHEEGSSGFRQCANFVYL